MTDTSDAPPTAAASPTFAQLGARPATVEALAAIGVTHAFAIQEYALPIALRGSDIIGQAPTGTGKTLGFGIPVLEHSLSPAEGGDGTPQGLIVVPTRELCIQVCTDLQAAGSLRGVRVLALYGGVPYEPQVKALRAGVEVIVGTPGRLLDLARQKQLNLGEVTSLVLDEADRMLDLGFLEDVEKILALLPNQRQTMLFSATMPDPIVALSRRILRNPVTIHAGHSDHESAPSPQTQQFAYRTHALNKTEVLARVLQATGHERSMVFCRTKRCAQSLTEELQFRGFTAVTVHGDLGQVAREHALQAFRGGAADVLVATDVAARGLDVAGVTHVVNYDCPEEPETYVHRIGRTGRAGATGVAVTFVDWEDVTRWTLIDKTLGLELPDPLETYHTSPHLYSDLTIPESAGGSLTTRAATQTPRPSSSRRSSGGRGRGGTHSRGGNERTGTRSAAERGSNRSSSERATAGSANPTGDESRQRQRRRRRLPDAGPEPAPVPATLPTQRRPRRRRRIED